MAEKIPFTLNNMQNKILEPSKKVLNECKEPISKFLTSKVNMERNRLVNEADGCELDEANNLYTYHYGMEVHSNKILEAQEIILKTVQEDRRDDGQRAIKRHEHPTLAVVLYPSVK
ncbi:hypothetical protein Tcan_13852 [Toxocara canis]|uniref:Uncharacterized protein n=1 Tax=Toxocara canis TaxID=6265 RepID=A0A0B2UZK6_TOXCA|nr:hypothetical protein Tcan_13852 [Toxocara canis]